MCECNLTLSKCRHGNCQYYNIYTYNNKVRVACLIKDTLIKNLKKDERDNCTKFKENVCKCTD